MTCLKLPLLLPPVAAPAAADTSDSDNEDEGASDSHEDVLYNDATEDLPAVKAKNVKVGSYRSALRVWYYLAKLMRTLHTQWDDHEREKRKEFGSKAQEYGEKWSLALCAHVNKKINYFYGHLNLAHLDELAWNTGHPFSGDDTVHEAGNLQASRLAKLLYWGGSSVKATVKVRTVKGVGTDAEEVIEVVKSNNKDPITQLMLLQCVKEVMRSKRQSKSMQDSASVQRNITIKKEEAVEARDHVMRSLKRRYQEL
mmetsp:Transcript_3811/g.6344  ORF Transcript_3811/g.6344 Transcript_3811/m.6344 type:complete len:255 (+) Transcript_3811:1616-2380(+)